MALLSTIKTLGGAVILRTLETYRLLITQFWPILILICVISVTISKTPSNLYPYIYMITALMLISVIILLSRSSMVRKDWRYVFMSAQTISILLWNVACITTVGLLSFILFSLFSRPGFPSLIGMHIVPSNTEIFSIALLIFTIPSLMMFWAYVLLDNKITWSTMLYVIPQSLYTLTRLLWNNLKLFLFSLILSFPLLLTMLMLLIMLIVLEHSFHGFYSNSLLSIFFIFPLYAAIMAVMYEEMRYNAGV